MKHSGNISDHLPERNAALYEAFKKLSSEYPKRHMRTICEQIIAMPAKRCYVGEERACDVVSSLMAGRKCLIRSEARRRMYEHLVALTTEIRRNNPGVTMEAAVFEAVNTPAPEYFISVATAVSLIYEEIRREIKCQRALLMAKFGNKPLLDR